MNLHPKVTAGALAGALTVIITAEAARRGFTIDGTGKPYWVTDSPVGEHAPFPDSLMQMFAGLKKKR